MLKDVIAVILVILLLTFIFEPERFGIMVGNMVDAYNSIVED